MAEPIVLSVEAGISEQQLNEVIKLLGNKNAMKAAQGAVSDTVRTIKKRIAQEIGKAVNLKIGEIKDQMDAKMGSWREPRGSITITRRAIPLYKYLSGQMRVPRPAWRGTLRAKVRKRASGRYGGGSQPQPGKFVAHIQGQQTAVFERTGVKRKATKGRYKGKMREAIRHVMGPTALGVFVHAAGEGAQTILRGILDETGSLLAKNLLSQMARPDLQPRSIGQPL